MEEEELPTAEDLLNLFPPVLRQAYESAEGVYDDVLSEPTQMPDDERAELDSIRSQIESLLQPQPAAAPIGTLLPGNEFSVSTAGLSQGINNMMQAIGSEKRRQVLFGDPERRRELQTEIGNIQSKAAELRQNAQKIRDGLLPADVLAGIDPMMDKESIAASVEEQADALEQEAAVMGEQLRQYSGLTGREAELARDEATAEKADTFRRQFINTFGQGMYKDAVSTMNRREELRGLENRETIRQDAQTARHRITQQRYLDSQRATIQSRAADKETPSSEFTPPTYDPGLVKQVAGKTIEEINQDIEQIKTSLGGGSAQRLAAQLRARPEQANWIRQLEQGKIYLQMIDQAATAWQRKTFTGDRKPTMRLPSELERNIMESMYDTGFIDPELINAWMWHNEISLDAPPEPLTPAGRATGDYSGRQP